MPYLKTPITAQNDGFYPQQMQPNPNQSPDEKPHAVGFKTDEERVIFFQNVAELMWRDGVIKRNTIPAFMEHAAFETANFYLYKLMDKVKRPTIHGSNSRDPYNHLDDSDSQNMPRPHEVMNDNLRDGGIFYFFLKRMVNLGK